ncbi:MAG: ABC transporter permease [Rikenellaceae bacterium]|nr:ABC transporter permease [Rikenellaceae bacterium]
MLWFNFARRYMFSPKSHSVINIIAMVSVIAVAVPTAATVILLAMFGGLDETIHKIYSSSDADMEITSLKGHTFERSAVDVDAIANIEGVEGYTTYLEQSIMIAHGEQRTPVTLRGVDGNYFDVLTLGDHIVMGNIESLASGDIIMGGTIAATLGLYNGIGAEVELYAMNRKQLSTMLPTSGVSRDKSRLGALFMANAELDAKYAIMDLSCAQQLLNHEGRITNIALRLDDDADVERIRRDIRAIVGDNFDVRTREEMNASMNEIMELEKFAIILIGCFIALIAAFSIVGSVVMLITEKRRDIATLHAMGANTALVRRIFVGEGMLLTLCGTLLGLLLGVAFSLIQLHYGIIKIEGNMVIESYPVAINPMDIIIVAIIMVATGWLISELSVRATLKRYKDKR